MASASGGGVKDSDPRDPKGIYATLGVKADANADEIRKAYRRLALRWHPDKNPDNPEATAEFQKISAAYEVLSDDERRQMYDETGCIDAEEMEGDDPFDLFAAFFGGGFGGGMSEDLDADEQAMLDEFLRIAGGSAFQGGRRGGAKKKKGRGGGRRRAKASSSMEEQMVGEMLLGALFGGGADMPMEPAAPSCPKGHTLKRRKADGAYECDSCACDIAEGKRIFECRKCDYSLCLKCHKDEEKKLEEEEDVVEDDLAELLQGFFDEHLTPVRQGRKLSYRCELCKQILSTHDEAGEHMVEKHEEELQAFVDQVEDMAGMPGMPGMPPGMAGMPPGMAEAMFMDMMGGGMMGGMMPGMDVGGARGSGRGSGSSKKKGKRR